jgi:hypothetical protein
MKTLLKYITLLLVSGVIIPLCCCIFTTEPEIVIATSAGQFIDNPVKYNEDNSHFSFTQDVAAKLLPVLNLFK